MNKKTVLILVSLFLFIISSVPVHAASGTGENIHNADNTQIPSQLYDDPTKHDYTFDSYDVNIMVNEDHTLDITITFDANVCVTSDYLVIYVPIYFYYIDDAGNQIKKRVYYSNYSADCEILVKKRYGYEEVHLNKNDFVYGDFAASFSYTCDFGIDNNASYDKFYFNMLGCYNKTDINNFSFSMTMPSSFDKDNMDVFLTTGLYSSAKTNNIIYSVNSNTLTGSYNGTIFPDRSINVELTLPDNYFSTRKKHLGILEIIVCIIPIICAVSAIVMYFMKRVSYKKDKTISYYPPLELNSAQVGYICRTTTGKSDIASLFLYLCTKGYIKIRENQDSYIYGNMSGREIIKLRDYDGNDSFVRDFMNTIFLHNYDGVTNVDIAAKNLESTHFLLNYKPCNSLIEDKIYIPGAKKFKLIISLLVTALVMFHNTLLLFLGNTFKEGAPSLIFLFIGIVIVLAFGVDSKKAGLTIFLAFWALAFTMIPWIWIIMPSLSSAPEYIPSTIITAVCILVMLFVCKIFPLRTPYGQNAYDNLVNFKTFLKKPDPKIVRELFMSNPNYAYDILPYAYALGFSNLFLDTAPKEIIPAPTWYERDAYYDYVTVMDVADTTMKHLMGIIVH